MRAVDLEGRLTELVDWVRDGVTHPSSRPVVEERDVEGIVPRSYLPVATPTSAKTQVDGSNLDDSRLTNGFIAVSGTSSGAEAGAPPTDQVVRAKVKWSDRFWSWVSMDSKTRTFVFHITLCLLNIVCLFLPHYIVRLEETCYNATQLGISDMCGDRLVFTGYLMSHYNLDSQRVDNTYYYYTRPPAEVVWMTWNSFASWGIWATVTALTMVITSYYPMLDDCSCAGVPGTPEAFKNNVSQRVHKMLWQFGHFSSSLIMMLLWLESFATRRSKFRWEFSTYIESVNVTYGLVVGLLACVVMNLFAMIGGIPTKEEIITFLRDQKLVNLIGRRTVFGEVGWGRRVIDYKRCGKYTKLELGPMPQRLPVVVFPMGDPDFIRAIGPVTCERSLPGARFCIPLRHIQLQHEEIIKIFGLHAIKDVDDEWCLL